MFLQELLGSLARIASKLFACSSWAVADSEDVLPAPDKPKNRSLAPTFSQAPQSGLSEALPGRTRFRPLYRVNHDERRVCYVAEAVSVMTKGGSQVMRGHSCHAHDVVSQLWTCVSLHSSGCQGFKT